MNNAMIVIQNRFEGWPITTFRVDGRPCWIVRDVATAIGYQDLGKGLVRRISQDWADEFVEGHDFVILSGQELRDFKHFITNSPKQDTGAARDSVMNAPDWTINEQDVVRIFDESNSKKGNLRGSPRSTELGAKHAPKLMLLFEPGIYLVLAKTNKPIGKKLRRFLVDKILPQLVRTGQYYPDQTHRLMNLEPQERMRIGNEMIDTLGRAVKEGLMDKDDAQRRWQESMRIFFERHLLVSPVSPHLHFSGKPLPFEWALFKIGPEYGFDGSAKPLAKQYEEFVMKQYPPGVVGGAKLTMQNAARIDGPLRDYRWQYPESLHRLMLPQFLATLPPKNED